MATRLLMCALLLLITGGCTTVRTTRESVGGPSYAANSKARVGLYYFLPRAIITIEGTQPKEGIFSIAITKTMVADRGHRYHLRWTQNAFYDDKVNTPIAVDADGLLTNIDVTATDQTPGIATDLLASVINVFKIASGGAQAGKRDQPRMQLEPFKYSFDPLSATEVMEVRRSLEAYGIKLIIDAGAPPNLSGTIYDQSKAIVSTVSARAIQSEDTPDDRGVFFHPPTTVEMRLDLRGAGAQIIHRENVAIPDTGRVACFRFGRAPLVKRDTILTLAKGVPVSFKVEQQSVVKAFTSLVSSLTGTIAGAVPTIVNVKTIRETAELNAEKTRIEAERQVLEEKKKLLQERKALMDAEAALSGATTESTQSSKLPKEESAGEFETTDGHTPATPAPTP
jgi:hypothetical protein